MGEQRPGDATVAEVAATLRASSAHESEALAVTPEAPGRYEFLREIGHGGMGRVVLVFDRHAGREVALKELLEDPDAAAQREVAARFLREARLTGNLEHPNIVPVHEVGRRESGAWYYTMRLVRGRSLADALRECRGLDDRLKLLPSVRDLANAIAFAHSRGVLHRDIKPANVMVGPFGETVVVDWGLAKVVGHADERADALRTHLAAVQAEGAIDQTREGESLGTPAYMSPEQASGEVAQIDAQSDVWGLGAVLYEVLTGHPPYVAPTLLGVLTAVMTAPLEPVRAAAPAAPAELAAVAEKALRRDRALRYQHATDVAADVEAYMSGRRVQAYQYSAWELLRRYAAHHKPALAGAAVALGAIVVALVLVSVALAHERQALRREHAARVLANLNLALTLDERARRSLADLDHASAQRMACASLLRNPAVPASPLYEPGFERAHPESQLARVEAASIVFQSRFRAVATLERTLGAPESGSSVDLSPDGRLLAASTRQDDSARIWDLASGRLLRTVTASGQHGLVAFSPGGALAVFARGSSAIRLVDPATGALVREFTGHHAPIAALAFSADGALLASASADHSARLWELATGRVVAVLDGHTDALTAVAFSPRGTEVATGASDHTVRLWRVPSGELLQTFPTASEGAVHSLAFAPDGRTLAVAGEDRIVRLLSVDDGHARALLAGHTQQVTQVSYSPDGALLASLGEDQTIRLWEAQGGALVATLASPQGRAGELFEAFAFSRRGDVLAAVGDSPEVFLYRLRADASREVLYGPRLPVHELALSRDGLRAAAGSEDRSVRVWDLASGTVVASLPPRADPPRALAFAPGGDRLAVGYENRSLAVWDLAHGVPVYELGPEALVRGVAFSPDGALLATSNRDGTVSLRDGATGALRRTLVGHDGSVNHVAFAPDGRRLASAGSDRTARLWDVATGAALRVLRGHTDLVWDVEFSADGRRLVSSSRDRLALLWDAESGRMVQRFAGHERWVNAVALSPDGALLATASDDQTTRLWDVATGTQRLILRAGWIVVGASFTPDRRSLVTLDGHGVVLYPLDRALAEPDARAVRACAGGEAGAPDATR